MLKKISKLKAVWKLVFCSDEFFLMTANHHPVLPHIGYRYYTNHDRKMFWIFLNDFVKNSIYETKIKKQEETDD